MQPTVLILTAVCVVACSGESRQEWWDGAKATLQKALHLKQNHNVAKNVILFLGDGMDIATVTAGRIYKGQKQGKTGEETVTTMESFPFAALSKTYNDDHQVSDSASTATAILSGVKVNYGTLGVDSSVPRADCVKQLEGAGHVTSVLKWSKDAGKSVGIVTTTRVTHATPAATYAHSADRDWESPWDLSHANATDCPDIAAQMIDNIDIDVILGGGRRSFLLNSTKDPGTGKIDKKQRTDGRDLIQEWKTAKAAKGKKATYVWNKGQFDAVKSTQTDSLLALFAPSVMQFELERDNTSSGEPSVAEMTKKAIEILSKNNKGFFLLVEGGRIDHGHHENSAIRALEDFVAFDNAVEVAVEMTNEKDTLIVVTADHGHTLSISGYSTRGHSILGLVNKQNNPWDKMPYTSLSYGSGPGPLRKNLTGVNTNARDYLQYNTVQMTSETHGGQDVAIFARGPLSHLFHSVHEQNYIAHVMAYASCVGSNKKHCSTASMSQSGSTLRVGVAALMVSFTAVYNNIICS